MVELVRRIGLRIDELDGVPETANVVITYAVERIRGDAGALMVPDGSCWRVAAGVGLRSLEHRYELTRTSWLIEKIALGHHGAIIQESDIAREQLRGAPLASWRHLVVAPVPDASALVMLARRHDPPFNEHDLNALAGLGREADGPIQAALDVRTLARAMNPFRDEPHGDRD